MKKSDDVVKHLGAHARARAGEVAELESSLRARPDPAATDRILAALAAPRPAVVAPARARAGRGWWPAAVVPLALAASVALAIRARVPAATGAPIGEYTASVDGRVEILRAANDAVATALEARAGSVQRVTVRPHDAVAVPVAARVLVVGTSVVVARSVEPAVSELGVVRFDVPGEILRGASEIRVVIAPPAELAAAVEAVTAAGRGPGPLAAGTAVVVRIPVETPAEKK